MITAARFRCVYYSPPTKLREGNIYRPQRSCGQGYVFTRVCDSVHRGGLRRTPPDQADPPRDQGEPPGTKENPPQTRQTPPRTKENPPDQGEPPRTRQTPPRTKENPPPPGPGRSPPEEDCSIWSMSGRYASYWNAFLFHSCLSVCSQGEPHVTITHYVFDLTVQIITGDPSQE